MDASHTSTSTGAESKKVFALSKLAESISMQLERTFSGSYWITAEISKLNYYPQSGHCYPQLVEKRDGKIIAEMRGFIASTRYVTIAGQFESVSGKALDDGMQILFRCRVGYHAMYGLSLNIIDIEPAYTLGEMARMRQDALRQLRFKGIFDLNKGLKLAPLLKRLAVVSVETSKGWRDFRDTLDHSPYGHVISTRLFPALLQGDAAVQSIANALRQIQSTKDQFDAVCIIRGGGGETGMDCYDSYMLAEQVCSFPLPLLTGIGHASNLTLVEQVAHRNLITPTALANYIIEGFEHFESRIANASLALLNAKRGILRNNVLHVQRLTDMLQLVAKARLQHAQSELQDDIHLFDASAKRAVLQYHADVHFRLPARLAEAGRKLLRNRLQSLVLIPADLRQSSAQLQKTKARNLDLLHAKAKLLDPANALKRGYSISTFEGKPITDATQLSEGDSIETLFAKGSASSTVTHTKP